MQSLTPTPSATSMNDGGKSTQNYLFSSYFPNKFSEIFKHFFMQEICDFMQWKEHEKSRFAKQIGIISLYYFFLYL